MGLAKSGAAFDDYIVLKISWLMDDLCPEVTSALAGNHAFWKDGNRNLRLWVLYNPPKSISSLPWCRSGKRFVVIHNSFMKKLLPAFFLLLVACSARQPVAQVVQPTSIPPTILLPTPTLINIPRTATAPPTTILSTNTPIRCEPRAADYCITDDHFILQRPIQPPYNDSVDGTYRYASTVNGTRDPHHGIEIGNEYGSPVQAAGDGVVLFAGLDEEAVFSPWKNFYGNVIVIQHVDGLYTLYAHLSKIDVQAGQAVTMGEKIGEVGQSGAATGSHLHFEVRRGDAENYFATLNPELWLHPKPGFGAMALSLVDDAGKFQRGQLTLQYYSDANEALATFYVDTYHKSLALGVENAGLGDLPAGRYRIALLFNGHLYERWVAVQSGKLTQVVIVVK